MNATKNEESSSTVEALYRLYKKHGPSEFEKFITINPNYSTFVEQVLNMDKFVGYRPA